MTRHPGGVAAHLISRSNAPLRVVRHTPEPTLVPLPAPSPDPESAVPRFHPSSPHPIPSFPHPMSMLSPRDLPISARPSPVPSPRHVELPAPSLSPPHFDLPASSILSSYRGSYIVEYAGSRIGSVRKRELVAKGCVYILQATSNVFVDASKDTPTNIARYINHCCAPNARVEIWEDIAGQARALVIASRRIGAGEEITIDYGSCSCPTNYLPDY
ncbi:hypothetical protein R3P38DRAFT_3239842 [Favolaschia claudopus]|uniref:SET domain-containing protein n=1 Tax=Favolaschia claudopus TaxID=2862362 RepID=A0AAV9Z705_9AGAR